jgi:hypothetical protein
MPDSDDHPAVAPEKFKSSPQALSHQLVGFGVVASRGDRTAIELFIAGVRGWEEVLRRQIK